MALVLADRVKDTTTTTGTGTVTLSGTAPTGFQNFSAIGDGNTTFYTIAGGTEWEVGIGTYTASGTTLSRDTVLSSSAGGTTKVTFSAGTKDVFVTYPAGKSISDGFGTLPVANGGTGAATLTGVVIGNGTSAFTVKTNPTGAFVGTTDTQTLTNKTITGTKETVFTITDGASVDIDPANGGIQLWTLGASRTPTANNFTAGQSVTLLVDDGSAYAITWSSIGVTWLDDASAPTLQTSGYTIIELFKAGSTVYGLARR